MRTLSEGGTVKPFLIGSLMLPLALICLYFYLESVNASRHHLFPIYDEVAILDLARDFKDRGSRIQVITDYFQGHVLEDTRHPLYPMMLAGSIRYQPEDFAKAKILNLAVGMALIISVFLLSALLWNVEVGFLSAFFVSASPIMVFLSNQATVDLLFAYLYFVSLAILMKFSGRCWGFLAFGVTCGLAYLTKPNGYFLLLAALILGLWNHRGAFLTKPHFYMALSGFAFTASFILFRNLSVFHNPLHCASSKVFWLDAWPHYYILSLSPVWERVGLSWYLSRHSFSQILFRILHGNQAVGKMLLVSMGIGTSSFSIALGCVMLGLALFGLALKWRDGHRDQTIVTGSIGFLFFLLFSWYDQVIGGGVRFVFPVAASLLPFSSIGALSLYGVIRTKFPKAPEPRILVVSTVSLIALLGIIRERDAFAVNPRSLWRVPAEWRQTSHWIREHLKEEEFLQDNASMFSLWDCCRNRGQGCPLSAPGQVLKDYVISKYKIKYIVLDQSLVGNDPFTDKYGASDAYGPTTFLGWPRCYHDDRIPSLFLIYSERGWKIDG